MSMASLFLSGSPIFRIAVSLPLVILAGLLLAFPARAASAPRVSVGEMTVYALLDRPGGMDVSLFSGPATKEQLESLMPGGKAPAGYNAFLIKAGGRNILVDTGGGAYLPGTPAVVAALKEAGIAPEDVSLVLLTHMHTDHLGGLLDSAKKPLFPNAAVLVSKPELDYWTAKPSPAVTDVLAAIPAGTKAGQICPFAFGDTVSPGIRAIAATGHTPGHTVFRLDSQGKSLIIIGDLIHAAALQFPLPDECARYDMDPAEAVKSRRMILDVAAGEGLPIAGMHLPAPPFGTVKAEGEGYVFTPLP